MYISIIMIALSLFFILFACYVFTNSIEWAGNKLHISSTATGSILAAIGTALPETVIPIIAILFYHNTNAHEIGIGAIAGSPFMLGTLAFFVTGLSVVIYYLLGKRPLKMNADIDAFTKDITFFIVLYGIAVLTTYIRQYQHLKIAIAISISLAYIYYFRHTLKSGSEKNNGLDKLLFTKYFNLETNMLWILSQCILSLVILLYFSQSFVKYTQILSQYLGISPLILAIIITPIATELPEKFNSIIWVGKNKDTLAIGNIAGAMVFQSCFPVAFGIIFTPWNLTGVTMLSAVLAELSAVLNLIFVKLTKKLNPFILILSGLFYAYFIYYIFK